LPARAIENQCFVLGVNRVGVDGYDKSHNGESQLCNPLGVIPNKLTGEELAIKYEVQKSEILNVRNQFPFLKDADVFNISV